MEMVPYPIKNCKSLPPIWEAGSFLRFMKLMAKKCIWK